MPLSTARRVREQAFRQELLLEAAERVFVERGFAGASVEEIARRGEVALATLYKSLPSKEAIFVRVIARRQEDFLRSVQGASADGSPLARLEAIVESTVGYFVEHEAVFRLYLAATQGFPWNIRSGLGEEIFERYASLVDYVESVCRLALPRARRGNARLVAVALLGAVNGFLTDWITASRHKHPAKRSPGAELWTVARGLVERA
jgi:AcrR family transcriptional regulator